MVAGIISDKYEKENLKTKPYICVVMSILAIPTSALCFSISNSFPTSMTFLFLEYLLAEGWNSPAISMVQQVVDPAVKGVAISLYLFAVTIVGTIGSVVVGSVSKALHTETNGPLLGYICAISCCVPCIFAIFCFYMASKTFEEFMKCQLYCRKATLDAMGGINKYKNT